MRNNEVLTFAETAETFGVRPTTITDLVRRLELIAKPTGLPGRSKGLDASDRKIIARALGRPVRAKATQTA